MPLQPIREAIAAALLVAGLTACTPQQIDGPEPSNETPATAPAADSASAGQAPRERPVAAVVNGRPISMDRLRSLMIDCYGLQCVEQLIALELVEGELARQNLELTDELVRAERDRVLQSVFGDAWDPAAAEEMLEQLLATRRTPRPIWELTLRRNAGLERLAREDVTVSEADLREAYDDRYGRRVVVRHIQTETPQQAQQLLRRAREGEDFELLARRYSRNDTARQGGLLDSIGPQTPETVPAVLRRAAMKMQQPGELAGPVQVGTAYHILRLEEVVPPGEKAFEKAAEDLRRQIRRRRIEALKDEIFRELWAKRQVHYANGRLWELHEQAR